LPNLELQQSAHDHLARLEGKSEEEKKAEIRVTCPSRIAACFVEWCACGHAPTCNALFWVCQVMQMQMLESVVENNKKQVEKEPQNSAALSELAKAQFELAMLYERSKATALLNEALSVVKKSLDLKLDGASLWVRAVLLQALGYASEDASDAKRQQAEARRVFDQVLAMESDAARRDALNKELDLLDETMRAWSDWMAEAEGKPRQPRPVAAAAPKKTVVSPGNEDMTGFVILAGMALVALGGIWCAESRSDPQRALSRLTLPETACQVAHDRKTKRKPLTWWDPEQVHVSQEGLSKRV